MTRFKRPTTLVFGALLAWQAQAADVSPAPLLPQDVLRIVEGTNPELAAAEARADAESARILSAYSLDRPRIGLMRENNMNDMQLAMGPMTSWSLTQEIMFPAKYFAMGSAQSSRAEAAEEERKDKRLEIRQRTLSAYFGLYAARRIVDLLAAQRETLREISRVAEARRATGAVPQQDEMKAHVEQTRIENEIILQEQETVEREAMLRALLNDGALQEIRTPAKELAIPRLTYSGSLRALAKRAVTGSRAVRAGEAMLSEARSEKTLAWLGFTPDFMLSYRKAFDNAPGNAYAFSIEATIPLWFLTKEIPEVRAARARSAAAEANLERMKRESESEANTLSSKVEAYSKLLRIYETSLIPQSLSALNSSRAAYSAGQTSFGELLDSERVLYANRIEYYRALSEYVDALTGLERVLGESISDLPFTGRGK
ncbi:MAG: TolC family protein [Bdellovibrionales bacterium]|nr:TolC family protein [Bdellovibrionales bacterium]